MHTIIFVWSAKVRWLRLQGPAVIFEGDHERIYVCGEGREGVILSYSGIRNCMSRIGKGFAAIRI